MSDTLEHESIESSSRHDYLISWIREKQSWNVDVDDYVGEKIGRLVFAEKLTMREYVVGKNDLEWIKRVEEPYEMIIRKICGNEIDTCVEYLSFEDDLRAVLIMFLICDKVKIYIDGDYRKQRTVILSALYLLLLILDQEEVNLCSADKMEYLPALSIVPLVSSNETEKKLRDEISFLANLELVFGDKFSETERNVKAKFKQLLQLTSQEGIEFSGKKRKFQKDQYQSQIDHILHNREATKVPNFENMVYKEFLESSADIGEMKREAKFMSTCQVHHQPKCKNNFSIINSKEMWKEHSVKFPSSKPCIIFLLTNGVDQSKLSKDVKYFERPRETATKKNKTSAQTEINNNQSRASNPSHENINKTPTVQDNQGTKQVEEAIEYVNIVQNHVQFVRLVVYDMNVTSESDKIPKSIIISAFNVLRQVAIQNSRANIVAICQHDYFEPFRGDETKKKELLSLLVDKFFKKLKNVVVLLPMSSESRPETLATIGKDRSNNFLFVSSDPDLHPDVYTRDCNAELSVINVASIVSLIWSAFPQFTSNHVRGQFIDQFCHCNISGNVMKSPRKILDHLHELLVIWKDTPDEKNSSEERNIFIRLAIDDYDDQKLCYPLHEASSLAQILQSNHDFVDSTNYQLFNSSATSLKISDLLKNLASSDEKLNHVIFYFAGMGAQDKLRFWDCQKTYVDLFNELSKVPCKHLLVILDCCFTSSSVHRIDKLENKSRRTLSRSDFNPHSFNAGTVEVIHSATQVNSSSDLEFGSGFSFLLNLLLSGKICGKKMNEVVYHTLRLSKRLMVPLLCEVIAMLNDRYRNPEDILYFYQGKMKDHFEGISFTSLYEQCEHGGQCVDWKNHNHFRDYFHDPICPYIQSGYGFCPYVENEYSEVPTIFEENYEQEKQKHMKNYLHEPKTRATVPYRFFGKNVSFNLFQKIDGKGGKATIDLILDDLKKPDFPVIGITGKPHSGKTSLLQTIVSETDSFEDIIWFDCKNYTEFDVIRQQLIFLNDHLQQHTPYLLSVEEGNMLMRKAHKQEFRNHLIVIMNCTQNYHLEGFLLPKAKTIISTSDHQGLGTMKRDIRWYCMKPWKDERERYLCYPLINRHKQGLVNFWNQLIQFDSETKNFDSEKENFLFGLFQLPFTVIHWDILSILADIHDIPLGHSLSDYRDVLPVDSNNQLNLTQLFYLLSKESSVLTIFARSDEDQRDMKEKSFQHLDKFLFECCSNDSLITFSWEEFSKKKKFSKKRSLLTRIQKPFMEFYVNYILHKASQLWEKHGPNTKEEYLIWIKFSFLHNGNLNSLKDRVKYSHLDIFVENYKHQLKQNPESVDLYHQEHEKYIKKSLLGYLDLRIQDNVTDMTCDDCGLLFVATRSSVLFVLSVDQNETLVYHSKRYIPYVLGRIEKVVFCAGFLYIKSQASYVLKYRIVDNHLYFEERILTKTSNFAIRRNSEGKIEIGRLNDDVDIKRISFIGSSNIVSFEDNSLYLYDISNVENPSNADNLYTEKFHGILDFKRVKGLSYPLPMDKYEMKEVKDGSVLVYSTELVFRIDAQENTLYVQRILVTNKLRKLFVTNHELILQYTHGFLDRFGLQSMHRIDGEQKIVQLKEHSQIGRIHEVVELRRDDSLSSTLVSISPQGLLSIGVQQIPFEQTKFKMGNRMVAFVFFENEVQLNIQGSTPQCIRKNILQSNIPTFIQSHDDKTCVFYLTPYFYAFSLDEKSSVHVSILENISLDSGETVVHLRIQREELLVTTTKCISRHKIYRLLEEHCLYFLNSWKMEKNPVISAFEDHYLCVQFEDRKIQLFSIKDKKRKAIKEFSTSQHLVHLEVTVKDSRIDICYRDVLGLDMNYSVPYDSIEPAKNIHSLPKTDDSFKKDRDVVLAAVTQDGSVLEYVDDFFKKDKDVVLAAVKQNGDTLEFSHDSLRKDTEVVMAAVKPNADALQYADDSFKKEKQMVLEVVRNVGRALEYVDDSLKEDKEVVMTEARAGGHSDNERRQGEVLTNLALLKQNILLGVYEDKSDWTFSKKEIDIVAIDLNSIALPIPLVPEQHEQFVRE